MQEFDLQVGVDQGLMLIYYPM